MPPKDGDVGVCACRHMLTLCTTDHTMHAHVQCMCTCTLVCMHTVYYVRMVVLYYCTTGEHAYSALPVLVVRVYACRHMLTLLCYYIIPCMHALVHGMCTCTLVCMHTVYYVPMVWVTLYHYTWYYMYYCTRYHRMVV